MVQPVNKRTLKGCIEGKECEVLLDMGANQSAILRTLVKKNAYEGSYGALENFLGQSMRAPLANVWVTE